MDNTSVAPQSVVAGSNAEPPANVSGDGRGDEARAAAATVDDDVVKLQEEDNYHAQLSSKLKRRIEQITNPDLDFDLVLEEDECDGRFNALDKLLLAEIFEDARRMLNILRQADSRSAVFKHGYEEILLSTFQVVQRHYGKDMQANNANKSSTGSSNAKDEQRRANTEAQRGWQKVESLSKLNDIASEREKIDRDRQYLVDKLAEVREELQNNASWSAIQQMINEERVRVMKEREIIRKEREHRLTKAKLSKQVTSIISEHESRIEILQRETSKLKDDLQELKSRSKAEVSYQYKMADASLNFAQHQLHEVETTTKNEIAQARCQQDEEERFHMEIEQYLSTRLRELRTMLSEWNVRAETDNSHLTEALETLTKEAKDNFTKLEKAQEQWKMYRKTFEEDEEEQHQTEIREREKAKRVNGAVILQAWWRGTMVRKKLGPFAVKKEKKKKKGKGKGKKGGAVEKKGKKK